MSNVSRREMLVRLEWLVGAISGSLSVSPLPALARVRAQTAIGEVFITLTPEEAETVRAIVSKLIPSDENGPGALEARADRYIDRGLAGALKASRAAYPIGLADLNSRAQIMKGRRVWS
jgi:gluconate 2-dehydrogenase gamma chain